MWGTPFIGTTKHRFHPLTVLQLELFPRRQPPPPPHKDVEGVASLQLHADDVRVDAIWAQPHPRDKSRPSRVGQGREGSGVGGGGVCGKGARQGSGRIRVRIRVRVRVGARVRVRVRVRVREAATVFNSLL